MFKSTICSTLSMIEAPTLIDPLGTNREVNVEEVIEQNDINISNIKIENKIEDNNGSI